MRRHWNMNLLELGFPGTQYIFQKFHGLSVEKVG
jgi:hypothetical protein